MKPTTEPYCLSFPKDNLQHIFSHNHVSGHYGRDEQRLQDLFLQFLFGRSAFALKDCCTETCVVLKCEQQSAMCGNMPMLYKDVEERKDLLSSLSNQKRQLCVCMQPSFQPCAWPFQRNRKSQGLKSSTSHKRLRIKVEREV